jgi:5,10-methylenetetrahydromethanopterin reductase
MSKSMAGTYAAIPGHDALMRIGLNGSSLIAMGAPLGQLREHAAEAEADGFSSYWLAQLGVPDALTAIATMGEVTSTIELGTAVIPTWPRHPLMLAAQASTVIEAIGPGRLILGLGLAHKVSVEGTLKIPFTTPAKHMEEYLSVLLPVLTDRKASFTGDIWSAETDGIGGTAVEPPTVMLAAMGPRMLQLAGARTAGSILWLSGPDAIADQIKPALDAAASEAGRPTPRIMASVPVCVTKDADSVKGFVAAALAGYNDLPSYRGVMDASGAGGPADVSLIGTEDEVLAGIRAFADAGATDFAPVELTLSPDDATATRELLKGLAADGIS